MFGAEGNSTIPSDCQLWYCINPKHWQEIIDYCSQMESYCSELKTTNQSLRQELNQLMQEESRQLQKNNCRSQRRKRRTMVQLDMDYPCPYARCRKQYASQLALNLHIKNKHNGGSKTQRENLARLIALAEDKGQAMPKVNINFPPGFLESFKKDFFGRR